jgi:hypothetical protein
VSGTDTETAQGAGTRTRQARLYLTRLDPWTVMKTAFVLSIGLAIVMVVATFLLWVLLSVTGTFDSINSTISDLGGSGSSGVDVAGFLSFGRIMGFALLLAAFEIVLTSALATVTAAIYNITVGLTGGIEVTLSEDH